MELLLRKKVRLLTSGPFAAFQTARVKTSPALPLPQQAAFHTDTVVQRLGTPQVVTFSSPRVAQLQSLGACRWVGGSCSNLLSQSVLF
jgi:hypothetical protein